MSAVVLTQGLPPPPGTGVTMSEEELAKLLNQEEEDNTVLKWTIVGLIITAAVVLNCFIIGYLTYKNQELARLLNETKLLLMEAKTGCEIHTEDPLLKNYVINVTPDGQPKLNKISAVSSLKKSNQGPQSAVLQSQSWKSQQQQQQQQQLQQSKAQIPQGDTTTNNSQFVTATAPTASSEKLLQQTVNKSKHVSADPEIGFVKPTLSRRDYSQLQQQQLSMPSSPL